MIGESKIHDSDRSLVVTGRKGRCNINSFEYDLQLIIIQCKNYEYLKKIIIYYSYFFN